MTHQVTVNTDLLRHWQESQEVHDRSFHFDIYCLPLKARVAHNALHFSKYVGRLARQGSSPTDGTRKTITDCALIALSAANALRLNLGEMVPPTVPALQEADLLRDLAIPTGSLADAVEKIDHLEDYGNKMAESVQAIVHWVIAAAALNNLNLDAAIRARRGQIRESRTHIGLRAIA